MPGLGRRILGWFGIVPGRVLQLDEICPVALERLRADALEGLSTRYLPSAVTIGVSPGDYALLRRFEADLGRMLQTRIAGLVAERGWARSSPAVCVRLEPHTGLGIGDSPLVETVFGTGFERGVYPAGGLASGERGDARQRTGGTLLEVVVTAVNEDATALQERFLVVLGAELPKAEASRVGEEAEERTVESGAEGLVTARLFHAANGRPALALSEAGIVVVGRERGLAHLVPSVPVATMSGSHLVLRRNGDGAVSVADLGSANGTWIGGERVGSGWRRVALPFSVSIGSGGRARIDVREAETREVRP